MFVERGYEHLQAGMAAGRGVVMVLPHVGSWEWGGAFLAAEGYPMTSVAERIEPPELFDWFVEQRQAMGLTIVPLGQESGGTVLRTLREGGLVGLLCDRDIVGNGIEVEFFGETTTFPAGPATLALRTGATLVAAAVYSGPGRYHTARHLRPVRHRPDRALRQDVARITQEIARGVRAAHPAGPRAVAHVPAELAERPAGGPSRARRAGGPLRRARRRRRPRLAGDRSGERSRCSGDGLPVQPVAARRRAGAGGGAGPAALPGRRRPRRRRRRPRRRSPASVRSTGRRSASGARGRSGRTARSRRSRSRRERRRGPRLRPGLRRRRRPSPRAAGAGGRLRLSRARHRCRWSARTTGPATVGSTARWARSPGGPTGDWPPAVRCPTPPATPSAPRPGGLRGALQRRRRRAVRRPPPWPTDGPTVLFLGRHEPRKGLGVLLDAFAGVPDPAVLWVAGDGPATGELRRRHPPSGRVHWLGRLNDAEVASRLAGADVLCAPSLGR